MRVLLTGPTSTICRELLPLLPPEAEVVPLGRPECDLADLDNLPLELIRSCDRFVLAHGVLSGRHYLKQTAAEIQQCLAVNLLSTVKIVEAAWDRPNARVVVIGSESGLKGSWDVCYGLAKSALHKYVEEKKIRQPGQQLVCVAPSLIEDSGMTARRQDRDNVRRAAEGNPKGRGLRAAEVARLVHHLLFVDEGYTTNTVIHVNGGKYARS